MSYRLIHIAPDWGTGSARPEGGREAPALGGGSGAARGKPRAGRGEVSQ